MAALYPGFVGKLETLGAVPCRTGMAVAFYLPTGKAFSMTGTVREPRHLGFDITCHSRGLLDYCVRDCMLQHANIAFVGKSIAQELMYADGRTPGAPEPRVCGPPEPLACASPRRVWPVSATAGSDPGSLAVPGAGSPPTLSGHALRCASHHGPSKRRHIRGRVTAQGGHACSRAPGRYGRHHGVPMPRWRYRDKPHSAGRNRPAPALPGGDADNHGDGAPLAYQPTRQVADRDTVAYGTT